MCRTEHEVVKNGGKGFIDMSWIPSCDKILKGNDFTG